MLQLGIIGNSLKWYRRSCFDYCPFRFQFVDDLLAIHTSSTFHDSNANVWSYQPSRILVLQSPTQLKYILSSTLTKATSDHLPNKARTQDWRTKQLYTGLLIPRILKSICFTICHNFVVLELLIYLCSNCTWANACLGPSSWKCANNVQYANPLPMMFVLGTYASGGLANASVGIWFQYFLVCSLRTILHVYLHQIANNTTALSKCITSKTVVGLGARQGFYGVICFVKPPQVFEFREHWAEARAMRDQGVPLKQDVWPSFKQV